MTTRLCDACGDDLEPTDTHGCAVCHTPLHAWLCCPRNAVYHVNDDGQYYCGSHEKEDPLYGQALAPLDCTKCSECKININGSDNTCNACATPMHTAAQCTSVRTMCYNEAEDTYTCRSCQGDAYGKAGDEQQKTKTKEMEENSVMQDGKKERPDFFSEEGTQQMRADRERINATEKYSLGASILRQGAVNDIEQKPEVFAKYCSGEEKLVDLARKVLGLNDETMAEAIFANRMHELRENKEYGDYTTALAISSRFSINLTFWIVDADTKQAIPHPSISIMESSEAKLYGELLQNAEQTHFLACFPEDEANRFELGGVRLQTNDGRYLAVLDVPMDGACQFSSFALILEQQGVILADSMEVTPQAEDQDDSNEDDDSDRDSVNDEDTHSDVDGANTPSVAKVATPPAVKQDLGVGVTPSAWAGLQ